MAVIRSQIVRAAGNLYVNDPNLSPASSLWPKCPLSAIASDPSIASVFHDDFDTYVTAHRWTSVVTDTGSVAIATPTAGLLGGWVTLTPSDGSVADNDEASIGTTSKSWILVAGKDIWFETRIKFTEANTDDANIYAGLSSVYAHNTMVDNGAGPIANYDGIGFYKVDGGTAWNAICSVAASQTKLTGLGTRLSGQAQRLGFHVVGGTSRVDFYIDGVPVGTIDTYLPTAALGVAFDVKNGDTNLEALNVDCVDVIQLR